MDCKSSNNLQERLKCTTEAPPSKPTMSNKIEVQEVTLDMHKELHNSTIMWSLGGMAGLLLLAIFCFMVYKLCATQWQRERERLHQLRRDVERFDQKM